MAYDNKRGAQQFPPREKTVLEHPKLAMGAFYKNNEKMSTLKVSFSNGERNPGSIKFTVYTNVAEDATDKNKGGQIQAVLDYPSVMAALSALDQCTRTKNNIELGIENKNFIFPAGKKSDKPLLTNTLMFGRDDDGVWMGVYDYKEDRPRIKFYFGPSYDAYNKTTYHRFVHGDGSAFSKQEESTLYARGYINILTNLVNRLMGDKFVDTTAAASSGNESRGNDRGETRDNSRGRQDNRQDNRQQDRAPARQSAPADDDFEYGDF